MIAKALSQHRWDHLPADLPRSHDTALLLLLRAPSLSQSLASVDSPTGSDTAARLATQPSAIAN
jgi:hypothetical protein